MEKRRPQLSSDDLGRLRWGMGAVLALLSVVTVFFMDIDAWLLMPLVTLAAIMALVRPTWPAILPGFVHRLAFPFIALAFVWDLTSSGRLPVADAVPQLLAVVVDWKVGIVVPVQLSVGKVLVRVATCLFWFLVRVPTLERERVGMKERLGRGLLRRRLAKLGAVRRGLDPGRNDEGAFRALHVHPPRDGTCPVAADRQNDCSRSE